MKEKQRKKFHWWYIPLGIVLVLVLTAGGLVLWMHSMLPWPNMVAMTSNFQMELSDPMRAYVVGGERDYSTLPEVLALQDGTGVETPEDMALRRAEVLDLFEKHVYGVLPKNGFETSFEVVEEGEALDGAALRRQVKLTVTTDKGSSDALLLMSSAQFRPARARCGGAKLQRQPHGAGRSGHPALLCQRKGRGRAGRGTRRKSRSVGPLKKLWHVVTAWPLFGATILPRMTPRLTAAV